MAQTILTPMEVTANNLAYNEANNPFLHAKRFEIQIHRGNDRHNLYFPTWGLVRLVLGTNAFSAADPKRPDTVLVCDNRDTCIQVLRWEKSWYGYATTVRRGAALGGPAPQNGGPSQIDQTNYGCKPDQSCCDFCCGN